jgi:DNA ligase-1
MFKPMLAPRESVKHFPTPDEFFDALQYPLLASPKLDGIRGIIKDGEAKSRSFKPLPSAQVQADFTSIEHLDGEFIAGSWTVGDVYNRSQSYIMSDDKPGDISFHVFDYTHPDWLHLPFIERLTKAHSLIKGLKEYWPVEHRMCYNSAELMAFEEEMLEDGYEGLIARNPNGHYKCGRGTFRQGLIYKIKREVDDEGVIVGFVERMLNNNTLETSELGYAKRSSSKEGKLPAGTLGKFKVEYHGDIISVAPGKFNHDQLQEIWDNQALYTGKLLKFRHFPHGAKDRPRQPRALGFRDEMDL